MERNEAERLEFIENLEKIPKEKIVFVDETGINNNEIPRYAWSYSGWRAPGLTRGHRSERVSIAGASRENQFIGGFLLLGAFDQCAFETFVQHSLVPNLQIGDVVIMDNARIHKSKMAREMIEAAGCSLLFQPPYSPDLNAIEHLWSPLKAEIRKHTERLLQCAENSLLEIASNILKLKIA